MHEPRIAHIDLTAFFVSVERALNPEWNGKPVMVAGSPAHRGVVTCASYEIRPYGIRAGMATALAIRKCPFAIRISPNHQAYVDYSRRVRKFLKPFAPVFEPASIDEFYIDWTGCEKLFGGNLARFAENIQSQILSEFNLPCAFAIASNKIIAKIACDRAKPSGVLEVPHGEEASFLEPLPVSVIPGVGKVTLAGFQRYNINTCGQLARVKPADIESLFGEVGLFFQEVAHGKGPQSLTTIREQKQISQEETFDEDTSNRHFLHEQLHTMALGVSESLRENQLKARCIHIKLRYASWETHTKQVTVLPTDDPVVLFKTAKRLLAEGYLKDEPLRLIGLGVNKLDHSDAEPDFFADQHVRRENLLKAVDQINHKFDKTLVQVGVVD